jgi:excinuclease ABC subunit B
MTVFKAVGSGITRDLKDHREATEAATRSQDTVYITEEYIGELQTEMLKAAEELEFERAGILRDRIGQLQEAIGQPLSAVDNAKPSSGSGRKGRRRKGTKIPRPKKKP